MRRDDCLTMMAARNPLRDMGLRSAEMTRRRLLAGMGAAAGAAALAGFGPGRALAQDRPLALLTWDAYADPRLLDLWQKDTGGTIKYEIHISDPTSVNRLRAGETKVWDVLNVNNPWARKQLWPEGLIRELPRDRFEPLYQRDAAEIQAALSLGDERRQRAPARRRAAHRDVRLRRQHRRDLARHGRRTRAGTSSTIPISPSATASSPTRTGTSWTSAWAPASIPSRTRPTRTSPSSRRRQSSGSRTPS